ncbi:DUF1700 domain-containing protein [Lachnospiraceae bacterium 48-42]
MNREEYMRRLTHRLRRLPKEDFDKAVSYFTEYFEEAGPENERQAIVDLGEPELAADQIVRDFAIENAREPVKDVKGGISAVWVGILAVFAAPIGLPLALALGAMGFSLVLMILLCLLAMILLSFGVIAAAVPCVIVSVFLLFSSFADGVATLGAGLIAMGIGICLVMGSIAFGKYILRAITCLLGRIAKGGRSHEK